MATWLSLFLWLGRDLQRRHAQALGLSYPGGVAVDAGFRVVERLEAELESRGVRLQMEVEILGIDKQRVGDDRVLIVSLLLPAIC